MAKKPLKDFFTNQRAQVADELEEMNKIKAAAEAELKVIEQQTAGMAAELEEFETLLTQTAERDRERMLSEAASESEMILERAQLQAAMSFVPGQAQAGPGDRVPGHRSGRGKADPGGERGRSGSPAGRVRLPRGQDLSHGHHNH